MGSALRWDNDQTYDQVKPQLLLTMLLGVFKGVFLKAKAQECVYLQSVGFRCLPS